MRIWHLTPDALRSPHRVSAGERVTLRIGTWPVEPGQSVWVTYKVEHPNRTTQEGQADAVWLRNEGGNSYWCAEVGPFLEGIRLSQRPHGMWPAEGAVSQSTIPLFAQRGVRWLATDRGVLARSGRWGYRVDDPDVLCQPYRAEEREHALSVFFRDTQLSDGIGFHYCGYADYEQAAQDFLCEIKGRFARQVTGDTDRVLTVVLDGENAWGAFREDARPFLHALYRLLACDVEVRTVTFAEYLEGNPSRGIASHPLEAQSKVYDLYRLLDR